MFRDDLLDFRLMKRESAVNSCRMESKKNTVQVCINLNSGRGGKYKMSSHAEVGLCVLSPTKSCGYYAHLSSTEFMKISGLKVP